MQQHKSDSELQQEWLKTNKVTKYTEGNSLVKPYAGKLAKQPHYRASKNRLASIFQSQDEATRDYGK